MANKSINLSDVSSSSLFTLMISTGSEDLVDAFIEHEKAAEGSDECHENGPLAAIVCH